MNEGLPKVESSEEALQKLILDEDLQRLEDLLDEFNLFDVLKIERRESQHSALLAWLLDARGSHGLRDYFLRRFLSEVAAEAYKRKITDVTPLIVDSEVAVEAYKQKITDVTPLVVDGWKLSDIEVVTERHNIDIMLIDETDGFVCFIENKIGAGEHSNQLTHYLETVDREYGGLKSLPIFLTPDGERTGIR